MRIATTALCAVLAFTASSSAQDAAFEYWPGARYDDSIPTFEDVLGFTADPNFRGYSHGLNVLFVNAVFRGAAHARPFL